MSTATDTRTPTALLLAVMNLKVTGVVDVVRTSDGFYIGMDPGDCGYNRFFGAPARVHDGPGLRNTLQVWTGLTDEERTAVRQRAAFPTDGEPIPLSEFGIEEET